MEQYSDVIEKWVFDPTTGKVITLLVLFFVVGFLNSVIKRRINTQILNSNSRYKAKKLSGFVSLLLCIILSGVVFSEKLGGITIAFGVAGAGVAFALQEVIASFAGWFAITFGTLFSVGDRVMLGGIRGDVIDVGMLRTTLMEIGDWVKGDLYNGRIVRISNSVVFKEPVYNYSLDFPFLWDEIVIPIKYGSDLKAARSLIKTSADELLDDFEAKALEEWRSMVKKYAIENARVDNMVTLTADENWASFTLRYVTDFKMRRATKDKLFMSILEKIDASEGTVSIAGAAIEVTYPQNSQL